MKNYIHAVMLWASALGATIIRFMGGCDYLLKLLFLVVVLDFISGTAVAVFFKKSRKTKSGRLDSNIMFIGGIRKFCIFVLVALCSQLDKAMGLNTLRNAAIIYFTGNEGLSLLENFGLMGVNYPEFLENILEALQSDGNSGKTSY